MRGIPENLEQMTDSGSSLQQSLNNARAVSAHGRQAGVLGAAPDESARQGGGSIDRANTLLASLNGVALRMDTVLAQTDQRVLSPGGVVDETQKAVTQANAILGEVRASLKRVDNLLADAEVVAGNTKAATADLGALRAEVEASLRKIATLIEEINRNWPFVQYTKIKLP